MRRTRFTGAPARVNASTASAKPLNIPSIALLAIFSGVIFSRVMPCNDPRASGRLGVRSPSRYGMKVNPPEPGTALSASLANSSKSTFSIAAVAVKIRAALSVHTSGRKFPVASAKPATKPDESCVGVLDPANAVPEVPSETTTSPGFTPSAKAAPMLSPVPGPMMISSRPIPIAVPTASLGPATLGSRSSWPIASSTKSCR